MVDHIILLDYSEIILRADGEPALQALREIVSQKLRERRVRVVPGKTPAYDSESARGIESGVKLIKDKTRTLVCWARELHGVWMQADHPALPWAIKFAGQILCRSHRGNDGRTA